MGRYKTYKTASSLEKAVEGYFRSISRTEAVVEMLPTGQLDKYGHEILHAVPVCNDDGEEMRQRVFHIPPTRGGLCSYLGISNSTWQRYCDEEENPKFAEICEWAEDQLLNWRNSQLLIRSGKHVRGLEVEMNLNYGKSMKQTVEIRESKAKTGDANLLPKDERAALLEELVSRYRGGGADGES